MITLFSNAIYRDLEISKKEFNQHPMLAEKLRLFQPMREGQLSMN